MATDAQRLITLSLTKIAQSRSQRGGVSLHKNLLVATVLQKARFIFMEEAFNMVNGPSTSIGGYSIATTPEVQEYNYIDEDNLVGLTNEETEVGSVSSSQQSSHTEPEASDLHFLQSSTTYVRCQDALEANKENHAPSPFCLQTGETLTYIDLDKAPREQSVVILRERSCPSTRCLKRRRAVAEWETEEAVLSILPKRHKLGLEQDTSDDSVFVEDPSAVSDCHSTSSEGVVSTTMEIDRITSLVSIFSFGGLSAGTSGRVMELNTSSGLGKLTRSTSTPDLCSAQAKESVDALQQRPFLAMTV